MKLLWNPTIMSFDFVVPGMLPSEGIQKISGFSRGWHHKNSVRLGIRKENEYYVLYLYAYIRGERVSKRICDVYEDTKLHAILTFNRTCVSVKIQFANGNEYESWCYFNSMFTFPVGYRLYPYAENDNNDRPIQMDVVINNIAIV